MNKLSVMCSPLTNKIYVGKTIKNGTMFGANKQEVTMECLIAVVEHALNLGESIEICKPCGEVDFEITVKDLRNK